jgi:glycosyltransferase involved in cell wall biosynthesis
VRVVIHNAARVWGGNEKWALLLAEGLRDRGHDVIISCRVGSVVEQRCRDRGIPATGTRPGAPLDVVRAAAFATWLRRQHTDALLLTSWKETLAGAAAGRIARVPRIVARLGIVREPSTRRHSLPFRRWIDALIVNAPEIRETWIRSAPWFPPDAIHVVRNGVPLSIMDRAAESRRLRAELGVTDAALLVGAAGIVTHRKGFDLLIDALADPRLRDISAVIAGDGPMAATLQQRAERLGLATRVHWLGHRTDVPRVLAGCDLFALTSRNEGMANVMLEAMAVGTPVIATDISGVNDAIGPQSDSPTAGWIVPPDNAAAFADSLAILAQRIRTGDPEVRRRADAAYNRIRDHFAPDRMVAEAEAILFPPP